MLSPKVNKLSFEPKILGFLCNWCSYAGADLAGVSRFQYPTNLRVIRVMCSGRVEPLFIIKAFKAGYDGVAVMGCHLGDCHYLKGNYEAEIKMKIFIKLMKLVDFDKRVMLVWVSASEGARFAQVVKDFTDQIRTLGPSPLTVKNPNPILAEKIDAIERVVEDFRIRALIGRERNLTEVGNVYGEKLAAEEFEKLIDDALMSEFVRNRIYLNLINSTLSVKDLAKHLNLDTQEVLNHILILRQRGLVAVDRIEDVTPLYTSIEV